MNVRSIRASRAIVLKDKIRLLCKCGCGSITEISQQTRSKYGFVKGVSKEYVSGHKPRKYMSIIWNLPKDQLIQLVKSNSSLKDILEYFGLENKGGNFKTLYRRLDLEGIDYSHILRGRGHNRGKSWFRPRIPLQEILVENSSFASRDSLKKRLLREGLLINECAFCSLKPMWNGKPLMLTLDHLNGISNDNRLENLRLLCPNCHSQTSTFAGRNNK